ncbi:unnamed protein product [Pieris macdunnoughi]|uniref:Sialin n=1 Tax=Pieris macdunnoughi TaxID=345717 RepID=A0A821LRL6_9NEOP|nr:unnamed protein product [Pieris macdunnoughi]
MKCLYIKKTEEVWQIGARLMFSKAVYNGRSEDSCAKGSTFDFNSHWFEQVPKEILREYSNETSWRFWRKRRLVVALLAFFGFFNVYALRVNLSVAVVAMTEPIEHVLDNGTIVYDSRGTQAVEGSKIRHPWREILTSGPVWAIVMAHFSENWGFYTLLTFLPTFMQDVFKFETSQTGWLSAVPYLAMAIVLQVAGHMADWLLRMRIMSRTNIRKLFNCGAFLAQTAEQWRIVFFISSAIYLIGAIVYYIFCSAERQPWVVEFDNDASFDTDAASVTTARGVDNKALDNSEI